MSAHIRTDGAGRNSGEEVNFGLLPVGFWPLASEMYMLQYLFPSTEKK